jgi:hypothetical protein
MNQSTVKNLFEKARSAQKKNKSAVLKLEVFSDNIKLIYVKHLLKNSD